MSQLSASATVFHFCNGLVTFCITWGIAISVPSRKRISVVAACVGFVLVVWGVMSLYALQKVSTATDAAPGETTHVVQQYEMSPERDS